MSLSAPADAPDWFCRQSDLVEVRRMADRGKGGRGVFALRDLPSGTVVERVPVLLIPRNQVFAADPAVRAAAARVSWYVFEWEGVTKRAYVALALGYGSIYNHSPAANTTYDREPPDVLAFTTVRDVAAGEELTINYRERATDAPPLGFDPH